MKLRPLHDLVLIRREKPPTTSAGGLYLAPTNVREQASTGEVLAVGPGRYLDGSNERLPVAVKPGDVVFFRAGPGQEVTIDGEVLVMLREEQLEGLVER